MVFTEEIVADARERLPKQRARLMGISIVTILYMIAGVSFKTVSILGTEIEIERPWVVGIGLGFGLGYWLIRYLQYFRESEYGRPFITREREFGYLIGPFLARTARSRSDFEVGLTLEPWADDKNITKIDAEVNDIAWIQGYRCEVEATIILEFEGESKTVTYPSKVSIEGAELRKAKSRTLFRVATRTPYFMEYILPIVLAALPVGMFSYRIVRAFIEYACS